MLALFEKVLDGPWVTAGRNAQYRVERAGDDIYIYFQCSSQWTDWVYNFMIGVVAYKDMDVVFRCHKGFWKVWQSIHNEIKAMVCREYDDGAKRVTIIGYSHGAGVATLAHEDLWTSFPTMDVTTFLFGSPKAIFHPSRTIRARFDKLYNIFVKGDIFTMLPFFPYSHVGRMVPLGNGLLPSFNRHKPEAYRRLLGGMECPA